MNASREKIKSELSREALFYSILVALLFIFLLLRAFLVPPVFDEANSFFYYIQNGKFWPFLSEPDTNNHVFNSLLSFLFIKVFGDSLFVLRLPNILAFVVYAYFVYKISFLLKSNFLRWILRFVLLCTLHIIEFFALGRGYGLSFALYLAAMYFVMHGLHTHSCKRLWIGFLLVFLSAMSNLAFVYTFWLLLAWVVLYQLVHKKLNTKAFAASLLPALLLAVFTTFYIFYLRSINELVAGNNHSFWSTTIQTLFAGLSDTHAGSYIANMLALGLLVVLIILSIWRIYLTPLKWKDFLVNEWLFIYLLAGNVIAIVFTALLLGVNYPDERIGTHLFLTGSLALLFLLDGLMRNNLNRKVYLLFSLPLLFYPMHFVIKANIDHSVWYTSNNIPRRFYTAIANDKQDFPPTLSAYHIKSLCWALADYTREGKQNPVYWNTYPAPVTDYMIVEKAKSKEFLSRYDEIDFDKVSECSLLKSKINFKRRLLYQASNEGSENEQSAEFVSLMEIDTILAADITLRVDFDIAIHSQAYPFTAMVVVAAEDTMHRALGYEYLRCNHMRGNWQQGTTSMHNSLLLYRLPQGPTKLKVYIWNQGIQKFAIGQSKVWLWEME